MRANSLLNILLIFAIKSRDILSRDEARTLLYPRNTALQITMCSISPIETNNGKRSHRVALNSGLTLSYTMPHKPKDFLEPVLWATRSLTRNIIFEEPSTRSPLKPHTVKKRDLSAGEFYDSVEKILVSMGFDHTCLLKSVCELAEIPFHDQKENFLHEILNFLLTPSLHQSFDESSEYHLKQSFEEAELFGKIGQSCDDAYPNCHVSPLQKYSKFITSEDLF